MKLALPLLSLVLILPLSAEKAEEQATDFIRVSEDEKSSRLQTAVTRYQGPKGQIVDLIGAVHIGDKKYYTALNESFKKYEVLLFELVGGENLVDGKFPEGGDDADDDLQFKVLRSMTNGMSRYLKLSNQMEHIDYSPKNFVHADMTLKQFEKKQKERGESVFGFALAAAQAAENGGQQPNVARLLASLLAGNPDGIKREMMKTLGLGDDRIAGLAGNNVIISDRNVKCLKVLRKQVKKGRSNIGIFYGAAHFPDMEKRLLEKGYRKTGQEWMTAWDVPKPAKKDQPAKAAPEKE